MKDTDTTITQMQQNTPQNKRNCYEALASSGYKPKSR